MWSCPDWRRLPGTLEGLHNALGASRTIIARALGYSYVEAAHQVEADQSEISLFLDSDPVEVDRLEIMLLEVASETGLLGLREISPNWE
jgi:hypothetical protein